MRSVREAFNLEFRDAETEADFGRSFIEASTVKTQIAMLLGSLVFLAFSGWDLILDPVNAGTTSLIRAGIVIFVLWPAILTLFSDICKRNTERVLLIFAIVPSIGLGVIFLKLNRGFEQGAAGMVIVMLFVFTLLPLRIIYLSIFCAVSWLSFEICDVFFSATPAEIVVVNAVYLGGAVLLGMYAAVGREISARRQFIIGRDLEASRAQVEVLLHSLLPPEIVKRIHGGETVIADAHDDVSVIFADLVGFTELSRRVTPARLIYILSRLFARFDEEAERHGIEKIKTIGDAYLAVGGMHGRDGDHAEQTAKFALSMQRCTMEISRELRHPLDLRVGLHRGPVIAGVIGIKRPVFDCWGDTVNIASRLENIAKPGCILVSKEVYIRLRSKFVLTEGELVDLKGVGPMMGYQLSRQR